MRTLNRLSWLLLAVAGLSLLMAVGLVAGAALLLHASLSLPTVWAVTAAITVFKLATDGSGDRSVSVPPAGPPQPEITLEDLERLRRMWQQGDIPEDVYRRAARRVTSRYQPPPPAPPRGRGRR